MKDTVAIYIRIRKQDGRHRYVKPVWTKQGKLKPLYALVDGREERHPEGVYNLRYRVGDARPYEVVGQDPGLVLATKMRREAALLDGTIAMPERKTPAPVPKAWQLVSEDGRHPLLQSIRKYLTEKKAHRSHKTYLAYSATWQMFLEFATLPEYKDELSFDDYTLRDDSSKELTPVAPAHLSIRTVEDITRDCVLNFNLYLKKHGSDDRTCYNRVTHLVSIFHHYELKSPLRMGDKPKFVERKVKGYSAAILERMFEEATEDEADLLLFALCMGGRAQELEYACWSDADLDLGMHTVTRHPDLGFIPKDKEEGSIPLPPNLVERLRARRKRYPHTRLIFPTPSNTPDGHLLRIIKRLALRAGVNCGHCINKKGQPCSTHPVCKQVILHKLRKTFARMMHEKGTLLRDVQALLRHSDPETTLRYVEYENASALQSNSVAAFGGFARGNKPQSAIA